jgi:hypothetical protein
MRPVHSQGKRAKGPPLELSPAEGAGAIITGGAEKGLRLFSFQIVGCCCCCWQKGAERGDVAMGSRSHVLNYVQIHHVVYRISGKSRVDPTCCSRVQKNDDDNNSKNKNDIYSGMFISSSELTLSTEYVTRFSKLPSMLEDLYRGKSIPRTTNSYTDTPNGLVG